MKLRYVTKIHYVAAAILWLLGILVLAFNLIGLETLWNMAMMLTYLYMPVPICASVAALAVSAQCDDEEERKFWLKRHGMILAVSAVVTILTIYVFSIWFR